MNYQRKIEYATEVAKELQENKSTEQIKESLKSKGLFERDITSIFVSARKIIGENYRPEIRAFLLADKAFQGAEEFNSLDGEVLETLINQERQKLALEERRKMVKLIKEGHSGEEVLSRTDNRFLSSEEAVEHLSKLQEVKQQNSGMGRMLNIGGGIGMFFLTWIVMLATERLFFILPAIGLGLIVKGLMTERMAYED